MKEELFAELVASVREGRAVLRGEAAPSRTFVEYDFSKGERGKFYRPNVRLNLPIYLDDDIAIFSRIAS